jgi:DNA modification methylase
MSVPTPYYDDGKGIVIYHGDCRDILPHLPKVDLVLTDPPYGLGKRLTGGSHGEWSGGFTISPEWDHETISKDCIQQILALANHAIIWGGNYYDLEPVRGWLAWDKMQDHSSGHFEMAWTTLDIPTRSFRLSRCEAYSQMNKEHPTQKPLDLMKWCLNFLPKSQTILDPFMGSGTTLRAAKDLGRQCIGIEIEEKYCEIAARRLGQEVLDLA